MTSSGARTDVRLAIIDNSLNPEIYRPVKHWGKFLKAPFESFRAPGGRFPDLRADFTHLILTGSEASIMEWEPWVDDEMAFVREAVANGYPVLGSCYGHQLLAAALAGPGCTRRSSRPEVGWYPIEILEKNGLLGEKGTAYAFCSHFDEAVGLGSDFHVLASTRGCPIQAFELAGRPVWGVQFHPEIDIPDARQFLRSLAALHLPTSPIFADALGTEPRDSGLVRKILRHFLDSRALSDQA